MTGGVRGERGQALVFAALLLGLAALSLGELHAAGSRLLDDVRDQRAGEAAVEAAGAVFADRLVVAGDRRLVLADPAVLDAARAAGVSAARANGLREPHDVRARLSPSGLIIELSVGRHRQRAEVHWP